MTSKIWPREDADCRALRHQTLNAARGYTSDGVKCICPTALAKLAGRNEAQRIYQKERRPFITPETHPMPRWWQGPWKISEYCPAEGHNTLRAALGYLGSSGERTTRCICPRAIELKNIDVQNAKARVKASRERRAEEVRAARALGAVSGQASRKTVTVDPAGLNDGPDWRHGLCSKNIEIADGGFDNRFSHIGLAAREKAKALCRACPLLAECGAYITRHEDPAGAWDGVWGGMDPANRRGYKDIVVSGTLLRVPMSTEEQINAA